MKKDTKLYLKSNYNYLTLIIINKIVLLGMESRIAENYGTDNDSKLK